jgi:hypothetical protein
MTAYYSTNGTAYPANSTMELCAEIGGSGPMQVSFTSVVVALCEPTGVADAAAGSQATCLQTYAANSGW